jgi:nucleoside-diphosphate-sugar epimerase
VDSTYIEDAARAHLLAGDCLAPGSPVAGKAYFISQGEPVPVWDLVNRILAAGGVSPVKRTVSPGLAYAAGCVLETVYRVLRIQQEPPMTRFVARQLSTSHWFDIRAARRDFGFEPQTSMDEGMALLAASLTG